MNTVDMLIDGGVIQLSQTLMHSSSRSKDRLNLKRYRFGNLKLLLLNQFKATCYLLYFSSNEVTEQYPYEIRIGIACPDKIGRLNSSKSTYTILVNFKYWTLNMRINF